MKRVAIIGADFVPSSLPPATRIRLFASYLPKFGWQPTVITTDPAFYDWKFDPENERLLPESIEVLRTKAWNSSWTRKMGFGDIGIRSFWYHWKTLNKLCRKQQIDLVFIPVPPSVPMVLGRLAHLKFGIPYVVDYIDPWVTEYYWKVPKEQRPPKWPLAYALSRTLEPFALKKVGHITGVSKGTTDSVVSRYQRLSIADASEIPYGADPADFDYLRKHPRSNSLFDKNDGLCHISYVGACIPGMHPTVRAILDALRSGLDDEPKVFGRVRFHFVGTSYAPNGSGLRHVLEIAKEMRVAESVEECTGRVPYLDSLQIMLDSDALLLIGSDEPHYTASKVFPYLLARKPLVSIFHDESSVVSLLRENRNAASITYTRDHPPSERINDIRNALRNILTSDPAPSMESDSNVAGFLSAHLMTARLAQAFELALNRNCTTQRVKTFSESLTK